MSSRAGNNEGENLNIATSGKNINCQLIHVYVDCSNKVNMTTSLTV